MSDAKPASRRRHDAELKRQVIAACAAPGASVAQVAMSYGLNANLVHKWRRLASDDGEIRSSPGFVPVSVVAEVPPSNPPQSIELELQRGAVHDFADSRGGQQARDFLGLPGTPSKPAWQGKLVCDDFAGYKACFDLGVTEVGCMAHARRKFHELWANHGSQVGERALKFFGQLYEVERTVADADSEARLAARQTARPLADALHQWLRQQRQRVPEGSATARAIDYSLKRWVALTRYLDDGELPIDNNWVENRIRPIALGRQNWLFAGSLRAGKRAAAVMSLIHSAKLNSLDPYAYLRDVLERLPTQPASRIAELLPHRWSPTT